MRDSDNSSTAPGPMPIRQKEAWVIAAAVPNEPHREFLEELIHALTICTVDPRNKELDRADVRVPQCDTDIAFVATVAAEVMSRCDIQVRVHRGDDEGWATPKRS